MNDLIEFLTKCNDEDEAAAKAAVDRSWGAYEDEESAGPLQDPYQIWAEEDGNQGVFMVADDLTKQSATHIALHDPARVLRECAARRQFINWITSELVCPDNPLDSVAGSACLVMAASYVDRPGFRDEWRVS